MRLVIKGKKINNILKHITIGYHSSLCDEHDGCGEQCSHAYCRY